MRRKLIIGLCILVVLLAGIGIYLRNGFYGNCVPERRSFYVRSGSEYRTLEDSLDAAIAHTAFFRFYARHIELDRSFKPGHYVLEPGMNVVQVARMLKLGLQTPVRVTINNVRTRAQLAGKLCAGADVIDRHPHGRLQSQFEHTCHLYDVHSRFQHVVPGFERPVEFDMAGVEPEEGGVCDRGVERIFERAVL